MMQFLVLAINIENELEGVETSLEEQLGSQGNNTRGRTICENSFVNLKVLTNVIIIISEINTSDN